MANDSLILGEWNVICQVCGFKKKASQIRRRWDGFLVCEDDYEIRHPQDFVRARPDTHVLPFVNPDAAPQFVSDFNYNCATMTWLEIGNHITADTTVYKARTVGPLLVDNGTLTVVCTLEVE